MKAKFGPLLGVVALLSAGAPQAATIGRPPIEGYFLHTGIISPNPETIARIACEGDSGPTSSGQSYSRFEYATDWGAQDKLHPTIRYICKTEGGGEITHYSWVIGWVSVCNGAPEIINPDGSKSCGVLPGQKPPRTECQGNPVNMGSEEKIEVERDYTSPQGLDFTRRYSSRNMLSGAPEGMGQGWRHNYSKRLEGKVLRGQGPDNFIWRFDGTRYQPYTQGRQPTVDHAYVRRPDGYAIHFSSTTSGRSWAQDSDVNYRLASSFDETGALVGWQLATPEGDLETYSATGLLLSIRLRNGQTRTLVYSDATTPASIAPGPGLLIQVVDGFGRSLSFRYNSRAKLVQMIDPAGQAYSYGYEDATGNLTGVTFPDGMRRQYLYNEPALIPSLADKPKMNFFLTGIVDETAPGTLVRYATFTYEPGTLTAARPISSEHAGGVDKHTFIYNIPRIGAHYWRVVDPLGAMRQHHYGDLNGTKVEGPRSQPGGSGCGPGSANVQHDDNSNPISKTNFSGATTNFSYDMARNLEIRRVEASGTPQARTVSTEWHPQFRLPTRIAEPKRITTMSYDANSNLASKSVQPTADADGSQGFAATPAGPARTWRYSFSDAGQLLSSVGPRNDSTGYSYSPQGELLSITNAAGHVTTLANYDPHGRPGRIVDANGLVTELSYSPRGWLTARSVGSQTTRYDYTGVGLLKTVTLPDGATLNYVHDDARRLLRVSDSVGGSIVYTLDNIGNRIKEQVIDPSGSLVRQTSREYDALNRLQQITGGQQ